MMQRKRGYDKVTFRYCVAQQVGLRHVYTSNVAPHEGTNTFCDNCGQALIQRLGFKILENNLNRGKCPRCRRRPPGVWR